MSHQKKSKILSIDNKGAGDQMLLTLSEIREKLRTNHTIFLYEEIDLSNPNKQYTVECRPGSDDFFEIDHIIPCKDREDVLSFKEARGDT